MRESLSRRDRPHSGRILVFWTTPCRDLEENSGLSAGLIVGRSSSIKGRTWMSGFGGGGAAAADGGG